MAAEAWELVEGDGFFGVDAHGGFDEGSAGEVDREGNERSGGEDRTDGADAEGSDAGGDERAHGGLEEAEEGGGAAGVAREWREAYGGGVGEGEADAGEGDEEER